MDKKIIKSELAMVRGLVYLACTLLTLGCTDQAKVTNVVNSSTAPTVEGTSSTVVKLKAPSPNPTPIDAGEMFA